MIIIFLWFRNVAGLLDFKSVDIWAFSHFLTFFNRVHPRIYGFSDCLGYFFKVKNQVFEFFANVLFYAILGHNTSCSQDLDKERLKRKIYSLENHIIDSFS